MKRQGRMESLYPANVLIFRRVNGVPGSILLLLILLLDLNFASSREAYATEERILFLTRLDQPLVEEWEHHKFVSETKYALVKEDGKPAIQAVGQESSSGLYKKIEYSLREYPWLEWAWKLEKAHKTADLRLREKEDMALGIFLIFSPSWLMPWKTKTVAYVWSGANHRPGQILMGPNHHYYVLQAGEEKKGRWITERRNLYEDYKRIYGIYPKKDPRAIGLFTDNDQTKEPVKGYYGPIRAVKEQH